jgi:hypothetical protein
MSASLRLNCAISRRVRWLSGHLHSERPSGSGVKALSSGIISRPCRARSRSRMICGRKRLTT